MCINQSILKRPCNKGSPLFPLLFSNARRPSASDDPPLCGYIKNKIYSQFKLFCRPCLFDCSYKSSKSAFPCAQACLSRSCMMYLLRAAFFVYRITSPAVMSFSRGPQNQGWNEERSLVRKFQYRGRPAQISRSSALRKTRPPESTPRCTNTRVVLCPKPTYVRKISENKADLQQLVLNFLSREVCTKLLLLPSSWC